ARRGPARPRPRAAPRLLRRPLRTGRRPRTLRDRRALAALAGRPRHHPRDRARLDRPHPRRAARLARGAPPLPRLTRPPPTRPAARPAQHRPRRPPPRDLVSRRPAAPPHPPRHPSPHQKESPMTSSKELNPLYGKTVEL